MIYFNKTAFALLLKAAIGDRSIQRYGQECEVDPGYISRLCRCKIEAPPSPQIIKKLTSSSHSPNITYTDMMRAAGYIEHEETDSTIDKIIKTYEPVLIALNEPVVQLLLTKLPELNKEEKEKLLKHIKFVLNNL